MFFSVLEFDSASKAAFYEEVDSFHFFLLSFVFFSFFFFFSFCEWFQVFYSLPFPFPASVFVEGVSKKVLLDFFRGLISPFLFPIGCIFF